MPPEVDKKYQHKWFFPYSVYTKTGWACMTNCQYAEFCTVDFTSVFWDSNLGRFVDCFECGSESKRESARDCDLEVNWIGIMITFSHFWPFQNTNLDREASTWPVYQRGLPSQILTYNNKVGFTCKNNSHVPPEITNKFHKMLTVSLTGKYPFIYWWLP